jgi:hypothetical protein
MKEPDNNGSGNTRRLKDFLEKKPGDLADDFEKEAREGFETITPDEAIGIRSRLDRRMHHEVLAQKKENKLLLRVAVAAMFLITLMSAYFILENQPAPSKNDLAIQSPHEPVPRQKESVPEQHLSEPAVNSQEDVPTVVKKHRTQPALSSQVAGSPVIENKKADSESLESGITSSAGKAETYEQMPEATPAVAMNDAVEDRPSVGDRKTKAAAGQPAAPTMRAARASDAGTTPAVIYSAGSEVLAARLKEMLSKNQLHGGFDATLYFAPDNRVTDCKVTWTEKMKGREKELEDLLSKLDGFSVSPSGTSGERLEYKIVYRPD